MSALRRPVYKAPTTVDWENDLDPVARMKEHLQIAVTLELYTTPLYLFALYSVNGDSTAARAIAKVAREEMLHFALAGNILCAIGGTPKVYGEKYTPQYPIQIFNDNVQLDLRATTKENLETFVKLERPPKAQPESESEGVDHILPTYESIGEFYASLEYGLTVLHKKYGDDFFRRAPFGRQFKPGDGSHGSMIAINDLDSAERAMKLIVVQGEGSSGVDGHYQVFEKLLASGVNHHNVVDDPKTEAFKDTPFYQAMLACDAAYCYLLSTIEILWTYDGTETRREQIIGNNIQGLMGVIRTISKYLVLQDAGNTKKAASSFNLYYKPDDPLSRLSQLQRETNAAVEASPELKDIKSTIDELVDIEKLTLSGTT